MYFCQMDIYIKKKEKKKIKTRVNKCQLTATAVPMIPPAKGDVPHIPNIVVFCDESNHDVKNRAILQ